MALANTLVALPQVRSGRLRSIAITSAKRGALMPRLPTLAESGMPGFASGIWYSPAAPAGTPRDVVTRLNREVARVVQLPDGQEKLSAQGVEPITGTPEQTAAFIRS